MTSKQFLKCLNACIDSLEEKLEKMIDDPDLRYPKTFNDGLVCGIQESLIEIRRCFSAVAAAQGKNIEFI